MIELELKIQGQLKSGKNSMKNTRSGHRYPDKKWAAWRDEMLKQINRVFWHDTAPEVIPAAIMFGECAVHIDYWPGDLRRRDVPGMVDALWHCFERAGIVKDDKQFTQVYWVTRELDRENPRAQIRIWALGH